MRLTAKLSAAVGLCIFVVLALNGFLRARADVGRHEADVERDHRVLGRAISQAVEHVAGRDGVERARELVQDLNARDAHIEISWIEEPTEGSPSVRVMSAGGERDLVTRFGLATEAPATLELRETLRIEETLVAEAYARSAAVALLLAFVSTIVMAALGAALVGRPIDALVAFARRVGAGDLTARPELRSGATSWRDEIAVLASELNGMTEALARTQARLDEELAARIAILEQLRHADRLRVVGEISSEFAHQIGTPLAAVRARAQLISQGEVRAERLRDTAEAIVRDVDRVSDSVRTMLDFSRRRAGQKQRVDVVGWARSTLDILLPLANRRRLAVILHPPPSPIEVVLDPIEMQQALTNLVMNAVQASSEGGRIDIVLERVGETLRIEVTDHGAGIPASALPHVFEPYFTTKGPGEGTGLGLSVAHGIVREHGGHIELASTQGQGTRVTMTLPLASSLPRGDGTSSWSARLLTRP
jgi:two-component system NtrC family sensor kinase